MGFAGAIPNLTAASADVVPAGRRGLGFALLQFLMTLGGAAGPLLVGVVSDAVGSLRLALLALLPPLFLTLVVLHRTTTRYYDEDAAGRCAAEPVGPAGPVADDGRAGEGRDRSTGGDVRPATGRRSRARRRRS